MECGTAVADYPVRQMVTSHASGGAQGGSNEKNCHERGDLDHFGVGFCSLSWK